MMFSLYTVDGQLSRGVSLADLLKVASEWCLFARAEDSGSEGCYVEVARWNAKTHRWERFAFEKCFGGEDGNEPGSAHATAARVASHINDASGNGDTGLIHGMPTWGSK